MSETTELTKCDVLKGAKAYLEIRELAKGAFYRYAEEGPRKIGLQLDEPEKAIATCAVGAILFAAKCSTGYPSNLATEARKSVEAVIGEALVPYNDQDATTKEMILDAFTKAITLNKCDEPQETPNADQV